MKTYQYTSPSNEVVAVFDADGISPMSMLSSLVPEGEPILPYVAPPTPVPQEVTRRQAKQALLLGGLLGGVQPAIDAIPDPIQRSMIQIEWDDSQTFDRGRPALIALGAALGLDDSALDALFVQASQL